VKRFEDAPAVAMREVVELALEAVREALERVMEAEVELFLGRSEEAVASYRRALEIQPQFAECLHDLGISLRKLGRLDEAVDTYRRALELRPKEARTHFELGYALYSLNRDDEAIASYERAVGLNVRDVQGFFYLGLARMRASRDAAAATAFEEAARLSPKDPRAHRNLAWLLATTTDESVRKPQRAVDAAKRATELDPMNADFATVLALARYGAGEFEAALEALVRAIELAGPDEISDLVAAACHARLGNTAQARAAFEHLAPKLGDLLEAFPRVRPLSDEARSLVESLGVRSQALPSTIR
jgi:tetratricopeptide (TPR) repeat protein